MHYYLLACACILSFSSLAQSVSPTVISTAGNSSQSGSVRLDQTIGEPLTASYTTGSNLLTQGFEQPVVSAVGLSEWEAANVYLFPNPAENTATVSIPLLTYTAYTVYDAAGRLIARDAIESAPFSFSVAHYPSGVYKLSLEGSMTTILTFIKR